MLIVGSLIWLRRHIFIVDLASARLEWYDKMPFVALKKFHDAQLGPLGSSSDYAMRGYMSRFIAPQSVIDNRRIYTSRKIFDMVCKECNSVVCQTENLFHALHSSGDNGKTLVPLREYRLQGSSVGLLSVNIVDERVAGNCAEITSFFPKAIDLKRSGQELPDPDDFITMRIGSFGEDEVSHNIRRFCHSAIKPLGTDQKRTTKRVCQYDIRSEREQIPEATSLVAVFSTHEGSEWKSALMTLATTLSELTARRERLDRLGEKVQQLQERLDQYDARNSEFQSLDEDIVLN
ncbi:hypothetical protein KEM56_005332 [Ascosphaera pollenicola]|nr:hypothetical protein KEM56_005332 [Ascosphaera pollenicola]